MDETDVQHLVSLVQHQIFRLRQVDRAAFDQVHQPARSGDQHIHAAFHPHDLHVDRGAAHDAELPDRRADGVIVDVLGDLGRKLTRRRQNQRAAGFGLGLAADVQQPGQHGQAEGRRLAGAGLGKAQKIATGNDGRDGFFLDGRGGLDAQPLQVDRHARVDPHAGKRGVDIRDRTADEFFFRLGAHPAVIGVGLGLVAVKARLAALLGAEISRTARAGGLVRHVVFRPGRPRIGVHGRGRADRAAVARGGRDTVMPAASPREWETGKSLST